MIVELVSTDGDNYGNFLYINDDWLIGLDGRERQNITEDVVITKVFKTTPCSFRSLMDCAELIYVNYNAQKIKELQTIIAEAQRELNKLSCENV